jgi:hypothetical protein
MRHLEYYGVSMWQRWTVWDEGEDPHRAAHRRGAKLWDRSSGGGAVALLARGCAELLPFVSGIAVAGLATLGMRALQSQIGRAVPGPRSARTLPGPRRPRALPGPAGAVGGAA